MKKLTFLEGIGVAFAFSLLGTLLFFVLNALVSINTGLYLTLSIVSFSYLLYLIIRSGVKTGRVTALTLWFVITTASWILAVPLSVFLLVQLSIVWLLRSLYFYSSLFSSLADLFLNGLSVAIAIWAGMHTGTVFLALWCFFLVQSLFVFIPASFAKKQFSETHQLIENDDFDKAYESARQAIAKLSV